MNIGISQLAFENIHDISENLLYLKNLGIKNVELVYSKFLNDEEIYNFKKLLETNQLNSLSAQSILFNSNIKDLTDLKLINFIEDICKKCISTQTKILVLGSPSCRNIHDSKRLKYIFCNVDEILQSYNIILCIEPNCKIYNGKYFTHIDEIVDFIKKTNLKNCKTMIDTHNLINENIDPIKSFNLYKQYIYHVHISENELKPFIKSPLHNNLSKLLKKEKYDKIITYELKHDKQSNKNIEDFIEVYS